MTANSESLGRYGYLQANALAYALPPNLPSLTTFEEPMTNSGAEIWPEGTPGTRGVKIGFFENSSKLMGIQRKHSATKNEVLGTLYRLDITPGHDVASSPRYGPFKGQNDTFLGLFGPSGGTF